MKKAAILLSVLMLTLSLAACGGAPEPALPEATPPAAPDSVTPAEPVPEEAEADAAMKAAYAEALDALMVGHTLPDGTDVGFEPSLNMEDNKFAIYDVDGDGADELIVMYTTTFSAGMVGCVFTYDGDSAPLRTELLEYPLLTFYDNRVVTAGWSHNQGLAGSFWPYNVYVYDAESDSYGFAASVDAWEKAFAATNFDGAAFPDDVDASGTGFVYYISDVGHGLDDTVPQDAAAYNEWLASYTGGAGELSIEWYGLSSENIASLTA